jgi:hypothetical protein
MNLHPDDFALNDTKWNALVAMNGAADKGQRFVIVDLQTKQCRAVESLDPFGGIPELEETQCQES